MMSWSQEGMISLARRSRRAQASSLQALRQPHGAAYLAENVWGLEPGRPDLDSSSTSSQVCNWTRYFVQFQFESESEVAQSCPTLWDHMDCSLPGSSVHESFHGKSTGVGCRFLLQGIFPTHGSNPALQAAAFTAWATREVNFNLFLCKWSY